MNFDSAMFETNPDLYLQKIGARCLNMASRMLAFSENPSFKSPSLEGIYSLTVLNFLLSFNSATGQESWQDAEKDCSFLNGLLEGGHARFINPSRASDNYPERLCLLVEDSSFNSPYVVVRNGETGSFDLNRYRFHLQPNRPNSLPELALVKATALSSYEATFINYQERLLIEEFQSRLVRK